MENRISTSLVVRYIKNTSDKSNIMLSEQRHFFQSWPRYCTCKVTFYLQLRSIVTGGHRLSQRDLHA